MSRFCLIGPTYPYRGGIAHYTTLLARHLREQHETLLISFSRQYPRWLFPGRSDRDPSQRPLRTDAEYLLDPLNPISWWHTWRRIAAWQPEIVVIPWWVPFWAPAWTVLGRGIKRLPNRPKLLFICHNIMPHEQGWISQIAMPWALRLALLPGDGFIVHSTVDGDVLRRHLPGTPFQITPLPTYGELPGDTRPVELPITLPLDRPLLLFCGLVRLYKGLDILLEALPIALAERPLHLLIAGEFWQDKAAIQAQIKRLNLDKAVTILDCYLPNELLAACVKRANVVILPYRNATQSAIIQLAFGYGRPVITTDVGGLAEAVHDSHTGLVVPPEDPLALAVAINRFFDEELETFFVKNIRRESSRFSWQHLIQNLLQLAS